MVRKPCEFNLLQRPFFRAVSTMLSTFAAVTASEPNVS